MDEPEIQLILQLRDHVTHFWEPNISESLYPMLASTKDYFDKFSMFSSNSVFHSSTSDKATTNSLSFEKYSTDHKVNSLYIELSASDIELSASDPPDFEFSSASFVVNFDEKAFEDRLKAATSHLKDDFSHSSYYSSTSATLFSEF